MPRTSAKDELLLLREYLIPILIDGMDRQTIDGDVGPVALTLPPDYLERYQNNPGRLEGLMGFNGVDYRFTIARKNEVRKRKRSGFEDLPEFYPDEQDGYAEDWVIRAEEPED